MASHSSAYAPHGMYFNDDDRSGPGPSHLSVTAVDGGSSNNNHTHSSRSQPSPLQPPVSIDSDAQATDRSATTAGGIPPRSSITPVPHHGPLPPSSSSSNVNETRRSHSQHQPLSMRSAYATLLFTNQLAHSSTFTPAGFSFDSPFQMDSSLPPPPVHTQPQTQSQAQATSSSRHGHPGQGQPRPISPPSIGQPPRHTSGIDTWQAADAESRVHYPAQVPYTATTMTPGDRFTQLLEEKMGLQHQYQHYRQQSQDVAPPYGHQSGSAGNFGAMPYTSVPPTAPRVPTPVGSHSAHGGARVSSNASQAYPQPSAGMDPATTETTLLDHSQVSIPPDYVATPIPRHLSPWLPPTGNPHIPVSIPTVHVNGPAAYQTDASRPRLMTSTTPYSSTEYWHDHAPSAEDMYPGSASSDMRGYSLYNSDRNNEPSGVQHSLAGSPGSRPSSHSPAVPSSAGWNYNVVGMPPVGSGWTSMHPPNPAELSSNSAGGAMLSTPLAPPSMLHSGSSTSGESAGGGRADADRFSLKKRRVLTSPTSKKSSSEPMDVAHQPLARPSLELATWSGQEDEQREKKVVIACYNCRAKKLKCDGGRPRCHHCTRRGEPVCEYDAVLRRRGPGKNNKRDRDKKKRSSVAGSGQSSTRS